MNSVYESFYELTFPLTCKKENIISNNVYCENVDEHMHSWTGSKKALLCYSLCWSFLAFRFRSNFCPILALYAKIPIFTAISFLYLPPYIDYVCGHGEHARGAQTGGEGGVTWVEKNRSQMCARNYSCTRFIPPSQGLIPAPGPVGKWGGEL